MNIAAGAVRIVTRTADATTAAAGAVGGAAINGVVGGIQGTVAGMRSGLNRGSDSPAAAALTLAAVGTAGLVEWPVLLAVGGTALAVHQLSRRASEDRTEADSTQRASEPSSPSSPRATQAKARPKATKAAKRTPSKTRRATTK
jgi:hypothetical protein